MALDVLGRRVGEASAGVVIEPEGAGHANGVDIEDDGYAEANDHQDALGVGVCTSPEARSIESLYQFSRFLRNCSTSVPASRTRVRSASAALFS